jgi:hypothetical protein
MHDPFINWPISCDWNCHITRNPPSMGGTDYGVSSGTPIHAAFDGLLINRPPVQYPNSGNVAILKMPDAIAHKIFNIPDLAFYHLHLSQFVTAGNVKEGDLIGYTGNTGYSTGPHLHINAFVGNTPRDVHDFYSVTSIAELPNSTIIAESTNNGSKNMFILQDSAPNGGIYLVVGDALVHVETMEHLVIIEAYVYASKLPWSDTAPTNKFAYADIQILNSYLKALKIGAPERVK